MDHACVRYLVLGSSGAPRRIGFGAENSNAGLPPAPGPAPGPGPGSDSRRQFGDYDIRVKCWGTNSHGQLGFNATERSEILDPVGSPALQFNASGVSVAALHSDYRGAWRAGSGPAVPIDVATSSNGTYIILRGADGVTELVILGTMDCKD